MSESSTYHVSGRDVLNTSSNPPVSGTSAIRGPALSYLGDPFIHPTDECVRFESDALIVMRDGYVVGFGPTSEKLSTLPANTPVAHYPDALILPGFIDCHVHYPQTEIIGAFGKKLIDWLNKYTFVAEQRFGDEAYAKHVADVFLRESLRCGTTTSAVYCTSDPTSVDAFFQVSYALNMRNIAGKVLMDRNAPKALLDTPQTAYDQTKSLIERWHGVGRALYAVTPRFAPTSSEEQMRLAGLVWREHPGTYLQSHLSESPEELEWVRKLYPNQDSYVDVYDHHGHLGPRSIFGHGVHLSETERARLSETGTSIAHCPTSNLFLGSGLFDIEALATGPQAIRVGLATDIGAGTSFSALQTMSEAYKVAQLNGYSLTAHQAFYLATLGAARALYLDDKVGQIAIGHEADIVVIDPHATPLLAFRQQYADSLEESLFLLMMLGDDRATLATYVSGERIYERAPGM